MKLSGCSKLSLHPLTGHWFRALNLRHWKNRLKTDHTRIARSRFSDAALSAPSYRILYLGETHQVAMYEVNALLGDPDDPVSNPRGSWALMSLRLRLHGVADVTNSDQQRLIATNAQELTGAWAHASDATPTQHLGRALHAIPDLEGFLYPSAKSGRRCLAIFMDKLLGKSLIEFHNEISGRTEKLV